MKIITSLFYLHDYIQQNRGDKFIFAEGDSWFEHPTLFDLIDVIAKKTIVPVYSTARHGDEAIEILSGGQKAEMLELFKRYSHLIPAVLFSGGGNDIVGPNLYCVLTKYQSGMNANDCIKWDGFNRKIDQLRLCYEDLLDLCERFLPGAKVITHTYDYAIFSDRGHRLLGHDVAGPWLKPVMEDEYGIRDKKIQREIVRIMIDAFADMLKGVEGQRGNFVVADTRDVLTLPDQWHDEIHPTDDGFKKVAEPLLEELRRMGLAGY